MRGERPGGRAAAVLLVLALVAVPVRPAGGEELLVFAAASLADALQELAPAWEVDAGARLRFSFAGSSTLARQIEAGAPADVFFSADLRQLDRLERAGRVRAGARRVPLSNALVVVTRRDGPELGGLDDLARLPRLALADPEAVPAGVYARELLVSRGLWEGIAPRVVPLSDVRAALAAVAAGHAPAGIVYATDAAREPRVRVAVRVPRGEGPEIRYGLTPIDGRPAEALAARLVDFLAGPRSRPVWLRHGFVPLD